MNIKITNTDHAKHSESEGIQAPADPAERNPMVPLSAIRPIAVEAIRAVTGCPDIKGNEGRYLVDELEAVAKAAARTLSEPTDDDDDLLTIAYMAGAHDARKAAIQAPEGALREALELIAGTDPVDAALDPQRAIRVARAALPAPANRMHLAKLYNAGWSDHEAGNSYRPGEALTAWLSAPAPQAPVALTDEQLTHILASHAGPTITPYQIARAVESAHGIPAPKEPKA